LNYIIPLIQKAQEKKPTNVSLYEIEGTLHEFLDDTESAAKCYRKITEIKPKDFFGYYKMGVLYFNKGAQYSQIVVNAKDDKEYHGLLDFADSLLKKALPFLEKAYELNPREITTVQALKEIYYRFRMENDTYRKNDEKYTRLLNEHENKSNKSNKSSGSLLDKFLDNIDDIIK
jgi:tetratricopeptide (TPR) repeat protein